MKDIDKLCISPFDLLLRVTLSVLNPQAPLAIFYLPMFKLAIEIEIFCEVNFVSIEEEIIVVFYLCLVYIGMNIDIVPGI